MRKIYSSLSYQFYVEINIPSGKVTRNFGPAVTQLALQGDEGGFFGGGPLVSADGGVEVVEEAFPAELGGFIGDFKLVDEKLVYPCPAAESTC